MKILRLVLASFLSGALLVTLSAQESDSLSIWLLDLEDVVVTAQYAPTDSRSAVHDIQTIKRETIEKRGATNLEQLLQQEASIRINQDLILGSSMSLLGLDGQNVKIMIDGVPVIGRQDGNIDLSQLNLQNIERVEIVEGPLSVNYGTDALAGVINLITKKSQLCQTEIGLNGQYESRGENSYSGFAGFRFGKNLLLHLNGGYDHFDGYSEDTLRSVLWNPKEQWYGDASLRYQFGESQQIRYSINYFDEIVTNLGEVRRPQFKPYAFDDEYHTTRLGHSLLQEGEIGKKYYLQSTLAYNHFRRQKNSIRTNFEENTQEEIPGQQDTAIFQSATFRTTFASRYRESPLNFQVGLDFRYDNAQGQRIQDTLSKKEGFSQIGDYAIFTSLKYDPTAKITLEGGLRYAYNTRYDAPMIPSLHLKYDPHQNWTIRASYGKGFRSPDLKELFFNFIDVNHFIIGNPNLKAEKSDNLQASLSFKKGKFSAGLKGFYNSIQDKIELYEYIETSEGLIPAVDTSTLQYAYFNQDVYKTRGGSMQLKFQHKNFLISTSLTLIGYYNPESELFSEVNEFSYAWEWASELSYFVPRYTLSFSLFTRQNDRRFSYFPELDEEGNTIARQREIKGFTMVDFSMSKRFWKEKIKLTAGVKNLLGVQQVSVFGSSGGGPHSGSTGNVPISPGRNFFVNLSLRLCKG